MKPLTWAQERFLDAFVRLSLKHSMPPTMRELAEVLDMRSTNGVNEHLKRLAADGYLERRPGRARGYVLTSRGMRWDGSQPYRPPRSSPDITTEQQLFAPPPKGVTP